MSNASVVMLMKLSIRKLSMSLTLLRVVGVKMVPSLVSSLEATSHLFSTRLMKSWTWRSYPKTDGTLTNLPSAYDLYGRSTRNLPSKVEVYKKFGVFVRPGSGMFVLFPCNTSISTSLKHLSVSELEEQPTRLTSASYMNCA